MNYVELDFKVSPYNDDIVDAIIYELSSIGFEGFINENESFKGYIKEELFQEDMISKIDIIERIKTTTSVKFEKKIIENIDWNTEWEKNFKPIKIDNDILVRTSFHDPDPNIEYEIIIEPKMSFGTGHHSTTALMLRNILEYKNAINDSVILDMGCGTGILSIMASKVGAKKVIGIDIDEWAYNNALENIKLNDIGNVDIKIGDAQLLEGMRKFHMLFANINKNIILQDMEAYCRSLVWGGNMFLSGFYESDLNDIVDAANKFGVTHTATKTENEWCSAIFRKITD